MVDVDSPPFHRPSFRPARGFAFQSILRISDRFCVVGVSSATDAAACKATQDAGDGDTFDSEFESLQNRGDFAATGAVLPTRGDCFDKDAKAVVVIGCGDDEGAIVPCRL